MSLIGQPSTATGVANAYLGLVDGVVIDAQDADQVTDIEKLGLAVLCTNTIMGTEQDQDRLAREVVEFARSLR